MSATFVGFGFGPIQTGLLLYEAVESGSFDRFVVAEVDQGLVDAVRSAGNEVAVNIAGKTGILSRRLRSIELYNPRVTGDRDAVVSAIAESEELGTAIPSVEFYSSGGESSIAAMLSRGARPGPCRCARTASFLSTRSPGDTGGACSASRARTTAVHSATLLVWWPSASEMVASGRASGRSAPGPSASIRAAPAEAGPGLPRAAPSVRMIRRRAPPAGGPLRPTAPPPPATPRGSRG